MSEIQTIVDEKDSKIKKSIPEQIKGFDGSIDFIAEAKKLSSDNDEEKARLVLNNALFNSLSNSASTIVTEIYKSCVEQSKLVDLKGVWTITKVYKTNTQIVQISGGIFYVADEVTKGGQKYQLLSLMI